MNTDKCKICGDNLSTGQTVVVSSGMQTLFKFSATNNDGLFLNDGSIESVVLHVQCRKNYTRRVTRTEDSHTLDFASFDFTTMCLFCDRKCIKDPKLVGRKSQDFLYGKHISHKATSFHILISVSSMCRSVLQISKSLC